MTDSNSGKKTVLIADDSQSSRDLLRYILTYAGFEVIEAVDGQDVLEKISFVTPDLFILDLNMPRCDGYTAARELRRLTSFAETPIVALSATASVSDSSKIKESGFTLFFAKPLSPNKVRECLRLLAAND